jgi:hypothetical protein
MIQAKKLCALMPILNGQKALRGTHRFHAHKLNSFKHKYPELRQ